MADQKQREKCLKEVDLMKPLDHPNIIKYIDSFIHKEKYCFLYFTAAQRTKSLFLNDVIYGWPLIKDRFWGV